MTKVRKFLVALSAALSVLSVALADGEIQSGEVPEIVIAFVAAGLVWAVPNAEG